MALRQIAACGCVLALALLRGSAEVNLRSAPNARLREASGAEPSAARGSFTSGASQPPRLAGAGLLVVAGGDVDFSRMRGARLVSQPWRDDFAPLEELLGSGDIRFANLESPICGRFGERAPRLVLCAPLAAARSLAAARIDVVSLANNHAWDYGELGLLQTIANLDASHVSYVGASARPGEACEPRIVRAGGWLVGFVAVTAAWNQPGSPHPGKRLIADADPEALARAIRQARALGADRILVSYHGGDEYGAAPRSNTRDIAEAAIAAGADAFIGHHPHVVQQTTFIRGKPVFYSLGNLLMRMVDAHPWTEFGMLAVLRFQRQGGIEASVCPFRMSGLDPVPLARDPERAGEERYFRRRFEELQAQGARASSEVPAELGHFDERGCAPLRQIATGGHETCLACGAALRSRER